MDHVGPQRPAKESNLALSVNSRLLRLLSLRDIRSRGRTRTHISSGNSGVHYLACACATLEKNERAESFSREGVQPPAPSTNLQEGWPRLRESVWSSDFLGSSSDHPPSRAMSGLPPRATGERAFPLRFPEESLGGDDGGRTGATRCLSTCPARLSRIRDPRVSGLGEGDLNPHCRFQKPESCQLDDPPAYELSYVVSPAGIEPALSEGKNLPLFR